MTSVAPHTIQWAGTLGKAGQFAMPASVGVGTGAAAGAIDYFLQPSGSEYDWEAGRYVEQERSLGRSLLIGAGVGAGVGLAVAGGRALHNGGYPKLPTADMVPTLPQAAKVSPLQHPDVGAGIGRADGSYWATVYRTVYRNGKSEQESYQVLKHFDFDLALREPIGNAKGYRDLDEAIREIAQGDVSTVYRQHGDRVLAYRGSEGERWSSIDDMYVGDPDTLAVISPYGDLWRRGTGRSGAFYDQGRLGDVYMGTSVHGEKVGTYHHINHLDPDIKAGIRLTDRSGISFEEALGELAVRQGDLGVQHLGNDRYAVFRAWHTNQPDPKYPLIGLRTTEHSASVKALELDGQVFVPAGGYWMTPRQA